MLTVQNPLSIGCDGRIAPSEAAYARHQLAELLRDRSGVFAVEATVRTESPELVVVEAVVDTDYGSLAERAQASNVHVACDMLTTRLRRRLSS